jgi:hypothetical protein
MAGPLCGPQRPKRARSEGQNGLDPGDLTTIALLEHCGKRQRQEALQAGAFFFCSKPELLVTQLRREAESRLASAPLSRSAAISRYRWDR